MQCNEIDIELNTCGFAYRIFYVRAYIIVRLLFFFYTVNSGYWRDVFQMSTDISF
jgi:hypothetical protein